MADDLPPRKALAAALPALLLAALLHLVPTGQRSLLADQFLDALHAPGFAVLTGALLLYLCPRPQDRRRVAIIVALACVMAAGLESAQIVTGRDADAGDLLADLIGIGAAAAAWFALRGRRLAVLPAVTFGLIALAPPIAAAHALLQQTRLFPVLADFESGWQLRMTARGPQGSVSVAPAPANWPSAAGSRVARIELGTTGQPGIELRPRGDWRGYENLVVLIGAAGSREFDATLRIHDRRHDQDHADRFNRIIRLTQQPAEFRFALRDIARLDNGRELDVGAIEALILFVDAPLGGEAALLGTVWLE